MKTAIQIKNHFYLNDAVTQDAPMNPSIFTHAFFTTLKEFQHLPARGVDIKDPDRGYGIIIIFTDASALLVGAWDKSLIFETAESEDDFCDLMIQLHRKQPDLHDRLLVQAQKGFWAKRDS